MRDGRYGRRSKQRGATFLGMVTIVAILGLGVYAGIRLMPLYMEYMAVTRAMKQTADSLQSGDATQAAIRASLIKRWEIEDIKQLDVDDIEINKVPNGIQILAQYRAEAPFIANVSFVVDFEKAIVIGGSAGP